MCLFNIDSNKPHLSNTTTIVGVMYDDGIILGSTDAITQLNSNVFLCHCTHETEILLEDAENFILDQENIMVRAETIGTMLSAYNDDTWNILQTGVIIGGGKKIYEISHDGIAVEKFNFGVGGYGDVYLSDLLEKEWKKGIHEQEAERIGVENIITKYFIRRCTYVFMRSRP
ncbi:hypothetical protein P3L10_023767 [Capsicum annuum]